MQDRNINIGWTNKVLSKQWVGPHFHINHWNLHWNLLTFLLPSMWLLMVKIIQQDYQVRLTIIMRCFFHNLPWQSAIILQPFCHFSQEIIFILFPWNLLYACYILVYWCLKVVQFRSSWIHGWNYSKYMFPVHKTSSSFLFVPRLEVNAITKS